MAAPRYQQCWVWIPHRQDPVLNAHATSSVGPVNVHPGSGSSTQCQILHGCSPSLGDEGELTPKPFVHMNSAPSAEHQAVPGAPPGLILPKCSGMKGAGDEGRLDAAAVAGELPPMHGLAEEHPEGAEALTEEQPFDIRSVHRRCVSEKHAKGGSKGDQPGARLQKPGSHIGTVDGITWQEFRRCFGDNADQLWGLFSNVVERSNDFLERRQEFHDLLERKKQERHEKATWTI